jgi:hypothetical protein
MDRAIELLVNRRGWVALVPGIALVSRLVGVEVSEDVLTSTGDQILAAVMSGLALWSLYRPRD